jgi:hypothetical protein
MVLKDTLVTSYVINVSHFVTVSFFLHKAVNTYNHFFTFALNYFTPLFSPCILLMLSKNKNENEGPNYKWASVI